MLYTAIHAPPRNVMTDDRKRVRMREGAKMIGLDPAYLSRLAKDGTLDKEGLTVLRPYPDVVEFYEDELLKWDKEVHSQRRRKRN